MYRKMVRFNDPDDRIGVAMAPSTESEFELRFDDNVELCNDDESIER